jgi:FKBP-type peptidyl-prolyl cis-trans isomerase SlyD
MKISNNKHVTLTYDLKVGEEGEELILMEQATTEKPMEFIFGTNSMLDAFEKQLENLSEGDKFSFTLTHDETYGEYSEDKVLELPKNIFEIDGKVDEEMLFEGNTLPMMDADGNRLMGAILAIDENVVTMDFNHPLAGETMHFEGTVTGVREASAEEIAAMLATDEESDYDANENSSNQAAKCGNRSGCNGCGC